MKLMAAQMQGMGNLDHAVVDATGLTGMYDFTIEFTPEFNGPPPPGLPKFDETGPPFQQALKEQLGLKLNSSKQTIDTIVIDHVERPSAN